MLLVDQSNERIGSRNKLLNVLFVVSFVVLVLAHVLALHFFHLLQTPDLLCRNRLDDEDKDKEQANSR